MQTHVKTPNKLWLPWIISILIFLTIQIRRTTGWYKAMYVYRCGFGCTLSNSTKLSLDSQMNKAINQETRKNNYILDFTKMSKKQTRGSMGWVCV